MRQKLLYRGRQFSACELDSIKSLLTDTENASRAALARRVCELLSWRTQEGSLKVMSAKVAMIEMQRDGLITLPEARQRHGNHTRYRLKTWDAEPEPDTPSIPAQQWPELHLELVDKSTTSRWNDYIAQYHYLGYQRLTGAQLRYFACSKKRVVALFSFSSAAWKTAPRDTYIGWSAQQRQRNLHLCIQNSRFLILPWIHAPNLASCLLAMVCRQLPTDWEARYHYRPVLVETFVEEPRFRGTCYRAANWLRLGDTTGRTRYELGPNAPRIRKAIYVQPLSREFRKILCAEPA